MLNFDDAKEIELSAEDRRDLQALSGMREWKTLRRIVESYMLMLTHNLVMGTEAEKDSSTEELKKLRGFCRTWKLKVVELVEGKEHHKIDEDKS